MKGVEEGTSPHTIMAKTKKNKTELSGVKACLVLTAVFNVVGVAGLFLAGYGTASLPIPIANFLLSQTFVYLLNGLLALGVVFCAIAIGKVNAYNKKAISSTPVKKTETEKSNDEDMPEITADDILRVANANHAEELERAAEEASRTSQTNTNPAGNVSTIDDILGNDDNPFVTDVRQETMKPAEEPSEEPIATTLPVEEPESNAATAPSEEEPEPQTEPATETNVEVDIPVLNELEQMLKDALTKKQIPTALYSIEADKEGAVCISCNPKDGEWYIYDIKNGKMVNFVFYAKDKGKTAGKVFLERVTEKMNSPKD